MLSIGAPSCGNGLQLSGSNISINGAIRSNGDAALHGSSVKVSGAISYGGKQNIGSNVTSGGSQFSTDVVGSGLAWTVSDFATGGKYSAIKGYASHIGYWTVGSSGATPGVHYVIGDVMISGNAPDLIGVTIVATGTVTISGGSVLTPARSDLPTVLADGGSCRNSAIRLSGSSITWSGVLVAPNGAIAVNGSSIRGDSIVGANIQLSGANIQIG